MRWKDLVKIIMRCIFPAAPAEALLKTWRLDIEHSLPPDQPIDDFTNKKVK